MKINVCSVDFGEVRQFNHEDFNKSIRRAKYIAKKMSQFGNNFLYEIDFEDNLKTFEDFNSFKIALKDVCK